MVTLDEVDLSSPGFHDNDGEEPCIFGTVALEKRVQWPSELFNQNFLIC